MFTLFELYNVLWKITQKLQLFDFFILIIIVYNNVCSNELHEIVIDELICNTSIKLDRVAANLGEVMAGYDFTITRCLL